MWELAFPRQIHGGFSSPMHERDPFTYTAIGLGLGLLLALLFLVWAVPEFRDPGYYARIEGLQPHRLEHPTQQELTNGAKWRDRVGSLVSMRDTFANWIIALFTIVATGVSLIAVILVYRSLGLTRNAVRAADDAVSETRRIGEAQVRAYIGLDHLDIVLTRKGTNNSVLGLSVIPIIRNTGNSPAFCTKLYSVIVYVPASEPNIDPTYEIEDRNPELIQCGAGRCITLFKCLIPIADLTKYENGQIRIFHLCYVQYRDVFWRVGTEDHVFTICTEIKPNMPISYYDAAEGLPAGAVGSVNHAKHRIFVADERNANTLAD